jgi:hypothetical protein
MSTKKEDARQVVEYNRLRAELGLLPVATDYFDEEQTRERELARRPEALAALNATRARAGLPAVAYDYFSDERERERNESWDAYNWEGACRLRQLNHALSDEETGFLLSLRHEPGMSPERLDAYAQQIKLARRAPSGDAS